MMLPFTFVASFSKKCEKQNTEVFQLNTEDLYTYIE